MNEQLYECQNCGKEFSEPDEKRICLEDEYGVGYEHGKHYDYILSCPYCGSELTEDDE